MWRTKACELGNVELAMVDPITQIIQEVHNLNTVELQVNSNLVERTGEEFKNMREGKRRKKHGTEARELVLHKKKCDRLHKEKCDRLHNWLNSAGKWCTSTARGSAEKEYSAALQRAEHLVEECSDHKNWLLKAVELWECVEHFMEVVLDLCWSGYIMCLGDHHANSERPEDWMSRLNELLESRSDVEARWFHKGCCENDTKELDDMVQGKLLDKSLKENGAEHQLANLLHHLQNQSEWRPSFLQKHPFSIYRELVVPSAKSSKKGAGGAILKHKWVYGMDFALKMRLPNGNSQVFFKEEFEKLHKYRSPYIVGVVGYWEIDSWSSWNPLSHILTRCPFLLMENMDYDLKVLMNRCKHAHRELGFSELETIYLMLPVAKALRFLHGKDVAHRDVKPQNIMCKNVVKRSVGEDVIVKPQNIMCKNVVPTTVGEDVMVKLIDFGEAMENASTPPVVSPAGTSGYMDPTMWKPKGDAMDYSLCMGDVFSFAIVFAELLTWRSPVEAFDVSLPKEAQSKLKDGERPPLPNDTSDYIRFIVESCWHADHLRRPDFKAICSMLQHAKFLLSERDFAYDPEEFFSYEDLHGFNRCISDIR